VSALFPPERSISNNARTLGLIMNCELYESGRLDYGVGPQQVIGYFKTNEADGLTLPEIFAAMCACPTCIGERIASLTDSQNITNVSNVTDAWGTPLHFMWSDDASVST